MLRKLMESSCLKASIENALSSRTEAIENLPESIQKVASLSLSLNAG